MTATLRTFLIEPLSPDVEAAVERLRRRPGARHVAIMPDVHLTGDTCVGAVLATSDRLHPAAAGSDLGCGVSTVALIGDGAVDREAAVQILAGLDETVPILAHAGEVPGWSDPPFDLPPSVLRTAARQMGTLGRGNHFLELQRADEGGLWVGVHSGSRYLGQVVQDHWRGVAGDEGLRAGSDEAHAWLAQVAWLRGWAKESRRRMAMAAAEVVGHVLGLGMDGASFFDADHDHVQAEVHHGEPLWVHRKGAIAAPKGSRAVIPGSMGTFSVHVEGRGHADALTSASHGAGRCKSRTEARRTIARTRLLRETAGVWFDPGRADALRSEAPSAYKSMERVLRAEQQLVKVIRVLRPVLVHKGA